MITKYLKGIKIETYDLSSSQFESACSIASNGILESGFDSLEDASQFVSSWIEDESFDEGYRAWLKECVDKGAEIFTLKEDWQPVGEIAIFK